MTPPEAQSAEAAAEFDRADPLARLASAFDLPSGVIYLDGNSLGPPPRRALDRLRRCAEAEWREGLIGSWNAAGWIDLAASAGEKIGRLIGAAPAETIVCDSVSVNLFKIAAALLNERLGAALVVEEGDFPTDLYVAASLGRIAKARLEIIKPGAPAPAASVFIKSLAHYKTAAIADMAAVERDAQARGVDVIWDLSHACGAVDIDVGRDGGAFAVGCGYKYLNGGPGAPAFIYAKHARAARLRQPIEGWMGHATPFAFGADYAPAKGAARFAAGTPPILALTTLDAALDLFDGVAPKALELKARALGDLFLERVAGCGFAAFDAPARRGGHVALRHSNGYAIVQALIAAGVVGDFREPDILRFGFSPLFLSYADVWRAGEIVRRVMSAETWREPQFAVRKKVI